MSHYNNLLADETSVSTSPDRPTPRRDFIGQITASAIVLATGACSPPAAAGQAAVGATPTPTPAPRQAAAQQAVQWDDSWFGRLTAKHKAVFDSPAIDDGLALSHATGYIGGMRDAVAAGPNDVQTVIVIRHMGIAMAFNDAIWAKYKLGEENKIKDSSTGEWALRNPYFAPAPPKEGARPRAAAPAGRPQSNLMWLAANGHVLLGCDRATHGYAGTLAGKTGGNSQTIYDELKANVVTGLILQPTGVYAVHRAQEAGCTFIKST
ncbi:MAG TPA: hypothetical protein VGM67_03245 [Gemmatimonadaceae bacterium]|jgi:hypothetical protein